ncbi:MAG: SpoIVB peptidase [Eubacteriales bacterium]|nr:SpoIVB peptidase [Eubacteriales bacterium]
MDKKKKYRHFVLWCLCLDLAAMVWLGYRYLDRKIPDEIHVVKGQDQDVEKLLEHPLLTFEDAITVSGEGSYLLPCKLLGLIPFKDIKVIPTESTDLMVSGSTVGIYMETQGVLIIDTGEIVSESGVPEEPAKNIVKSGDYIVAFNQQEITSKRELMDDLETLDGDDVTLGIKRNGETIPVSVTPVKDMQGEYKLGIWVRDDTQGIGTLTFVDTKGHYGALGHGISDVDTGELLNIKEGSLYQAQILGIHKGSKGSPGELSGLIRYEPKNIIGTIDTNSKNGIYGEFEGNAGEGISLRQMPVGYKQEMEIGPASILCCVENQVEEYQAEITKIDMNHEDSNKSFVIRVTDEKLLSATGGIVQGMSGSPVLQNGKIVGAVTHVFVQDSTSGYGIFIENMLKQG